MVKGRIKLNSIIFSRLIVSKNRILIFLRHSISFIQSSLILFLFYSTFTPQTSKSGAAAALLRRVSTAAHHFHPTEIRGQRPACVVSFCSSFSLCCKVTEIPFHKRVCASGDMGHRDYHEATLALNQKQTATFQSGHF